MTVSKTRNPSRHPRLVACATAAALAAMLAGCGGIGTNRSLYSVHQPVVQKMNYTLDLNAGSGGLAYGESDRLEGWFEAMDLDYGDKVGIDDPSGRSAARASVERIAARHGLLVVPVAPQTTGQIAPGALRVVVTRTVATVPTCPDWSSDNDFNPLNAASANYGCATNSNLAAMIANPDDLVTGASTRGDTVSAHVKAVEDYRNRDLSGSGALKAEASKGN